MFTSLVRGVAERNVGIEGVTDFSGMSTDEILNVSIESVTPDQYHDYEKALQEFLK